MLTKERCDECIEIVEPTLCPITLKMKPVAMRWLNTASVLRQISKAATPDEAELFAYRLLNAVKRARENRDE